VFAGEVEARARKDPRLQELNETMTKADATEKARLRTKWNELFKLIHSEKLGEMAAEFDRIHSVHRALAVGALHHIIPPANLRPFLIHAVERGVAREKELHLQKTAHKLVRMKKVARGSQPETFNERILDGTD
jgi:hypothetical protein